MSEVRRLATGLDFPEGPVFDTAGGLWAVELRAGNLIRWRDGQVDRVAAGGGPNGLAMDGAGGVWICDAERNELRRFDPVAGSFAAVACEVAGGRLFKPNDLAFDDAGNLVVTCPGDSRSEPTGYVAVRRRDGTTRRIAEGLFFPNGLAFSPDGRELVVAETYRQRLWRGVWDPEQADWSGARVWCAATGGSPGPDGMAFDAAGRLFVAVYGAGRVSVISPQGDIVAELPTPGRNPTNCAFDPTGRLGLVVTEAERGELLAIPGAGTGASLFHPSLDQSL
jgi:gluconolactonase